jgi:hypothetical protein
MATEGSELAQTPEEVERHVGFPKMRAASQREAASSFKASKAKK